MLLPGCWTWLAESSVQLVLSESDSRQSLLLAYTLLLREGLVKLVSFRDVLKLS